MVRAEERPHGLDPYVRRKDEETGGDKLLRPTLGRFGIAPASGEPPNDDEAGQRLDEAVEAEADQRNGRRRDPRRERDREFHDVPAVAAPRKETGAPH
jgi:hypothetical protein